MAKTHECDVDEWIVLALLEYEQIASLSNVQSLLGNSVLSMPSSSQTGPGRFSSVDSINKYDPDVLSLQMQQHNIHDLMLSYSEKIGDVRKTHARMKAELSCLSSDSDVEPQTTSAKRRPSPLEIALKSHIDLSERVIRTIMRSPPPGSSGPCGLFFENGLVRTPTANDHENNIVALASLRASISCLKSEFGGDRK